jgi:hypothetical protein
MDAIARVACPMASPPVQNEPGAQMICHRPINVRIPAKAATYSNLIAATIPI